MKASDYIVEFIKDQGVTDVFGYPGGMVTHLMDSLSKSSVRSHVTYHEQGAAFAACGYAQTTGKVGVAYATSGPGATNLITGICNAYFDSIPTVFITGHGMDAADDAFFGGFITNAIYCFYQNQKNGTWSDYTKSSVWGNNLLFCLLAGALWYSQFFGLSLGKGFLTESPTLTTLAFCILMALNVVFSNVWGIILKEWKGCSQKTITVLIVGIIVLVISCFLPQLI